MASGGGILSWLSLACVGIYTSGVMIFEVNDIPCKKWWPHKTLLSDVTATLVCIRTCYGAHISQNILSFTRLCKAKSGSQLTSFLKTPQWCCTSQASGVLQMAVSSGDDLASLHLTCCVKTCKYCDTMNPHHTLDGSFSEVCWALQTPPPGPSSNRPAMLLWQICRLQPSSPPNACAKISTSEREWRFCRALRLCPTTGNSVTHPEPLSSSKAS